MTTQTALQYANPFGVPMLITPESLEALKKARRKASATKRPPPANPAEPAVKTHQGWRVEGIPPGDLEAAAEAHAKKQARKKEAERQAFDAEQYLNNAKAKPLRRAPYQVQQAAVDCKTLAERAGWLRVRVVELTGG